MIEVKPEAMLYFAPHTDEILDKLYVAARRCYSERQDNGFITTACGDPVWKKDTLIEKCLASGHDSILEHCSFTFHIVCSRACSHQIVRHRVASYSQQSQRYVECQNLHFLMPNLKYLGENYEIASSLIEKAIHGTENTYRELIELGVYAEDARCVLPQASATSMMLTMNFRELLHFFELRCCYRAQEEIRDIATQMLSQCKYVAPFVFKNAGPKCMSLKKCPEAKPCGLNPWKVRNDAD